MHDDVVEIDVRPPLEQGRSPLPLIMNTASTLAPGETLRLLTSWEPLPLYEVMGQMGFEHRSERRDEELWQIDFKRNGDGTSARDFHPPCII